MSSHSAAAALDHHHDPTTSTGIPNKKLLMWAFLASDCMFFGSLIATHLIYRLHPPADNMDPKAVFAPALTSFSTFILLMSSLMMALAVNAIQKSNVRSTRWWLLGTMLFGLIFLGGQVYEFNEFVHIKKMTLSNSILGSTFFTLTGTHGTHVAIGVLWLGLMYVRSFKPLQPTSGWLGHALLHVVTIAGFIVLTMYALIRLLLHVIVAEEPMTYGQYFAGNWWAIAGAVLTFFIATWFAKPRGPVAFNEYNAVDVESMGLYWHFVDIVWIVIFTAVYLLEFI